LSARARVQRAASSSCAPTRLVLPVVKSRSAALQSTVDAAELRGVLEASKGVVIMCPDSADKAVKESLNVAFSEMSPKKHKVAIAESFGGNDEPVDRLTQDLIGVGIDPELTLRVRQEPTEQARAAYVLLHGELSLH
jgi:flavorubredoxin